MSESQRGRCVRGGDRSARRVSVSGPRIERAIERLRSLHEGYAGVSDAIACGGDVVPMLRELLFEPDPSGIFEPRCRAAAALAGLRAFEVLTGFLKASHHLTEPVAQAGEEAVVSCVARNLTGVRDERVFDVLLDLARRRPIMGVIEALGSFERCEAIPALIAALWEDDCRPAAAAALLNFGQAARSALSDVAAGRGAGERETDSDRRARRCATDLLARIALSRSDHGDDDQARDR